jgi:tRNA A-37 threonylcarbamoyl transferase component Bud32/dienelactone hydrolase
VALVSELVDNREATPGVPESGIMPADVRSAPAMIGSTLTHYAIDAKLGEGGMGTVYRARDTVLGRAVAIKVLSVDAINDPDLAPRILREAKAASRLNHPNIVTVYELARSGAVEFIVMEYVEGEPLARRIPANGLPIDQVIDYALPIADALAAAHEAGLVHRDVKPGNVMITPSGRVKVVDFGLARELPVTPDAETQQRSTQWLTRPGGLAGTVGYMAPEQIEGRPADARSDVFALGVVMFELLTGHRPFTGDSAWDTMHNTVSTDAPDVRRLRPETPPALARIVTLALARSPDGRYPSARVLAADLAALRAPSSPVAIRPGPARRWAVIAAAAVLGLGAAGAVGWQWVRESRLRWARTAAVAEINQQIEGGDLDAAFRLARRALAIAPDDLQLHQIWSNVSVGASLSSDPSGAEVAVKGYVSNADWLQVGTTPIRNVSVPFGMVRWRVTKSGYAPLEVSGSGSETSSFHLTPAGTGPPGMVFVARGPVTLDTTTVDLPDYWIDTYEVTNQQFKQFVDAGGYRRRDYWTEPFVRDGRALDWAEAMAAFHDATGRPGPATWEVGAYPDGQDDFPVTGVSWYEAGAYARFVHKQLPTVYHWYKASGAFSIFSDVLPLSNFSGRGPARVGQYRGVGPYGTYDMAGNAKEWCWNETNAGLRYVLGGAWDSAAYQFRDEDAQSPFSRRPGFGLRTMIQPESLSVALSDPIRTLERDPASLKPVGDDVYRVYLRQFDYDRGPLDAIVEATADTTVWRREKVSFAAAYGKERVPVYLFLPRSGAPPYQAVVFFPGADAVTVSSSNSLWLQWADFFVRSGRVLVYPVYQGTYERRITGPKGPSVLRDVSVQRGKDLRRTIDYLETRTDIDASRLAFYGLSLGAQLGPLFLAIEPRLRTGVLMSGGFETWNIPSEIDPVNYAPRVTVPVLMVNGRDDFDLQYATKQVPMFRMLGTPAANKKHAVFEGGHIPARQQEPIKEMLDWLDRYLGPVKGR